MIGCTLYIFCIMIDCILYIVISYHHLYIVGDVIYCIIESQIIVNLFMTCFVERPFTSLENHLPMFIILFCTLYDLHILMGY